MNQVVGRQGLVIGRRGVRIQHMKANVSLDDLGHESVHSASACGNVMQYLRAFGLFVQRPFDCLYLACACRKLRAGGNVFEREKAKAQSSIRFAQQRKDSWLNARPSLTIGDQ